MQDILVLKLANADDAISIARMSAALIENGLPQAWSAARVRHHIRSKESVVLIAKAGEHVMGFALMEFGEDSAHLNLLAVSTLARRCGIGRRMLEWLHETAITAGTFLVSLELRATNSTALKFYAAMGYRENGYRSRYYCGKEDAICMSRSLSVVAAASRFL
jgi:ribosomal-protein-alanine N-acetyltransferase